jgi:hypothetical protein
VKPSHLIVLAVLLGGCASAESEAQKQADAEATDDAKCRSYGYKSGTPDYDNCRAKLVEQAEQADRAALAGRLLGRPPPGF